MSTSIKGEYVKHSMQNGFLYRYICPECKRAFLDNTPEASVPTLCHRCYLGQTQTVLIEEAYKLKKPRRKPKHKHPGESL